MSIDGKITTQKRKKIKFSNQADTKAVDKLRSEFDAILVGQTTIKNDDPNLILKNKEFK